MPCDDRMKRRSFLAWAGGGLTALAAGAMGKGLAWAHQPMPFKKGNRKDVPAAKVQGLAPGVPTNFPEARAWLVLEKDGSIIAFDEQCTHKGCQFAWNASQKEFQCPCHQSRFDATGKVLGGPTPKPLTRLKVEKAQDGALKLLD
ncbi:MAG: Rieske 2Fe-2S domain-containing protein [Thermodesulfobacteriota bacterium]